MTSNYLIADVAGSPAGGLGHLGYRALKSLDERSLELLITLALAMATYALAFRIHVSDPIAVVVAGLLIGNPGRRFAMSKASGVFGAGGRTQRSSSSDSSQFRQP